MTSWWRNAALGPIPSTEMISNPGKPRKTKNSRSLFSPKDAHYECRLSGHIMNDEYPKSKKRKQLIPCFESLFSFCFVCLLCCFFFPGVRHSWALTNFSSRSQEVTRDEETNLTASSARSDPPHKRVPTTVGAVTVVGRSLARIDHKHDSICLILSHHEKYWTEGNSWRPAGRNSSWNTKLVKIAFVMRCRVHETANNWFL